MLSHSDTNIFTCGQTDSKLKKIYHWWMVIRLGNLSSVKNTIISISKQTYNSHQYGYVDLEEGNAKPSAQLKNLTVGATNSAIIDHKTIYLE